MMLHDLPSYYVVYQQAQRWIKAQVFEPLVHNLRAVLQIAEGRQEMPTVAIFDSRTLQSSVESVAAPATTGRNATKATKSIWRLIPWRIF
jgi:hypothetical protein